MKLKADSRSLPLLHDDVVLEIFKFLSLPDRKNARLVCRQWHRVSNRRIFAEKEAFFVSNMYKIRTIVQVLVKCKRQILNLRFEQRIFGPSSNILWRRCGRKIQSLQFRMCSFPPNIIKRIFINCQNLTEFWSNAGGIERCHSTSEELPRRKSILQLNDDIVRPKLKTLHLASEALAFRECDLRLIASAFPQLKSLTIRLCLSEEEEIRDSPNFTVLLNVLGSGLKNLENLNVGFRVSLEFEPTDFATVPHINLDRLKNVSMSFTPFLLEGDSLTKILNYKFWRSLQVHRPFLYPSDMTVVTRLVNENPLLEELEVSVTYFTAASEFSDLFKALVKSRLKSLKVETADAMSLEVAKLFIAEVTCLLEGLPCNDTVEYLSVNSNSTAEFTSLFVKYFRNIRDLYASPGNVNTIFQYQTNLKCLTIQPLGAIRTDEPPARTSIESLEMLHLKPLALDVFTTYQFPNLKYLLIKECGIYCYDALRYDGADDSIGIVARPFIEEYDDLERKVITDTNIFIRRMNALMSSIFRKSPNLEAIEFDCDYRLKAEAFHVFFQSCLHFHQLRYVSFFSYSLRIDKMETRREVVKYFKKCPSFRGLWVRTSLFNLAFYFNIVTKKYEFSNEFSRGDNSSEYDDRVFIYFGVNLSEYWRNKR